MEGGTASHLLKGAMPKDGRVQEGAQEGLLVGVALGLSADRVPHAVGPGVDGVAQKGSEARPERWNELKDRAHDAGGAVGRRGRAQGRPL